MFDGQIIAFFLVAGLLTITPGADTMLVIRNVLRGGRTDGLATTFGIVSGLLVHASLSAVGVSVILAQSVTAFRVLKLAGATYLIWLGIRSLRAAARSSGHSPAALVHGRASARQSFREGLLTNLLNPKVVVFYVAFLPQFIEPGEPVLAKSLLLAAIHLVQGVVWLGGLSFALERSRRFILLPNVRRVLEGVCGTVLVAFGLRLALVRS
ncbi:MAG: LysE family translocator [Gammaproteobacteria bacterium]